MNNSWLTFDPAFPIWVIILITLPIFIFFIGKEIQLTQKFLILRIIAQVFIFLSIIGLFLRPSYLEQKAISKIILLTPGYDNLKVDSVVKKNPSYKIIHTREANPYLNLESLISYHNLAESGDIKIIMGEGLPGFALEMIEKKNFEFIPNNLPIGTIQLSIPQPIVVNKKNLIQGVFNSKGKTTLRLISPAGVEDSVDINGTGQTPFVLSFRPRQPGLFVFTLSSQDSSSNILTEKLPIEILAEQKLKILILQKFPSAEVRYLKNYLAEKGHSLALRYQTSKTNFKYEYANLNSIRVDRLTAELTKAFDLVFLDNTVLEELSNSEKSVLENSIRSGLGAIILFDDFREKGKTINQLLPLKTKRLTVDTVHIRFPESKLYTLPVLPIEIIPNASIQSITLHKGRTLSGYVYSGFGKVGFQLLRETYRISLEGNAADYSSIWSDLIERTARAKNKLFKVKLDSSLPYYPDEPLSIEVISSGPQPSLYSNKNLIPLAEDVVIDDYWHGKSWADKAGWHQFFIQQDSTELNYFVSNKGEWESLRIAHLMKENELAPSSDSDTISSVQFIRKPIQPLIFFLIFLFASAFLWLAPKI